MRPLRTRSLSRLASILLRKPLRTRGKKYFFSFYLLSHKRQLKEFTHDFDEATIRMKLKTNSQTETVCRHSGWCGEKVSRRVVGCVCSKLVDSLGRFGFFSSAPSLGFSYKHFLDAMICLLSLEMIFSTRIFNYHKTSFI